MKNDPFQIPTSAELRDGLRGDITKLTAEVARLTAELQGERDDLAKVYKAKAKLIDERDELRDYNQRLLAENVRLSNEAAEVREDLANAQTWIGGQDTFSDFKNAGQMRWALVQEREKSASLSRSITAACTGSGCLNAHELRVALDKERDDHANTTRALHNISKWVHGEDFRAEYQTATAMRNALNTERERCGVLEREVRAWRAAYNDYQHSGVCDEGGTMNEPNDVSETDTRHALDAAKFGKEQA